MKNDRRPPAVAYTPIRRRLWFEWTLVALIATLFVFVLSYTGMTRRVDNIIYDRALSAFPPAIDNHILLVTIDDDSLQQLGRWPWSRDVHARMVERLHASGAKAVAYDVLFPDAAAPEDDAALASALQSGTPVILPLAYSVPGLNGAPYDVVRPIPELANAAKAVGHVSLIYDSDGVVRRVPLSFGDGADRSLHIMEQLYRLERGRPSHMWDRASGRDHEALISYQAQGGGFSTISFASVLNGEVPSALIKDKLVLVGAAASGMGDIHPTPTGRGGTAFGVELMANILNAMEQGKAIREVSPLTLALSSLAPIAVLLVSFWLVRPRTTLILALALILAIFLIRIALLKLGLWVPPSPALIGVVLVYPLWGWRRLQAIDDFVGTQLKRISREDNILPSSDAMPGLSDYVGQRAFRLEQAISEVRELRRIVSDILEQLPDPMMLVDSSGRVRLANADAEILFGTALYHDQALNLLRSIAVPEDRRYFDALNPEEDEDSRITFRSRAGRSYEIRSLLVRADNGELRGLLYYLADVTGQKRAAEEREEMLQLLTHDMRSPQSSILALLDGVPAKPLAVKDYDRLRNYARRTLTLADNFVHLARLKGTDFEPEFVDLSDIVQEAADALYTLAHRRGVRIQVSRADKGEYWVMGEPGTLHRAFCNLFDNAVKYSPDKGVISARLSREGDCIRCDLVDQGAGIEAELAERLFTRFAKGGAPTAQPLDGVDGAGLGLNFVLTVVDRHGGHIRTEAKEAQKGAHFVIELPAAGDDDAELEYEI